MRRRRVEVVVALLDVFAVVALAVGQAEQPLLQDRVAAVPERQRKAEDLLIVAEPEDAVLAPTVRAAPSRVVADRVPGRSAGAVVLANRAPLASSYGPQGFQPLPAGSSRRLSSSMTCLVIRGGSMTLL